MLESIILMASCHYVKKRWVPSTGLVSLLTKCASKTQNNSLEFDSLKTNRHFPKLAFHALQVRFRFTSNFQIRCKFMSSLLQIRLNQYKIHFSLQIFTDDFKLVGIYGYFVIRWISDQARISKYSTAVGGINIFKTNFQYLSNTDTGKFQR